MVVQARKNSFVTQDPVSDVRALASVAATPRRRYIIAGAARGEPNSYLIT